MKLVEILARDLSEWPDNGCVQITQDADSNVFYWRKTGAIFENGEWEHPTGGLCDRLWYLDRLPDDLAEDHKTAIVTRAQWEAEKMKQAKPKEEIIAWDDMKEGMTVRFLSVVPAHKHWRFTKGKTYKVVDRDGDIGPQSEDGGVPSKDWGFTFALVSDNQAKPAEQENKWIRNRGRKNFSPYEPGEKFDIVNRNGKTITCNDVSIGYWDWSHTGGGMDIMRHRLHKPEQQPSKEEWMELDKAVSDIGADVYVGPFKTGCAADSIKMDIDFPSGVIHIDGPLAWRDRIREIDTTVESLEEERASLIQRLEDEGFKLVRADAKVPPKQESLPVLEWLGGGIVKCINDYAGQFKSGNLYTLTGAPRNGRIEVTSDDRGEVNGWVASAFEFHSRP